MIVPQTKSMLNHALHPNLPERKLPVYVPRKPPLIKEKIQTVFMRTVFFFFIVMCVNIVTVIYPIQCTSFNSPRNLKAQPNAVYSVEYTS